MINETLIIHGKSINVLTGDQLSTAELAQYADDAGAALAASEFNHSVPAADLAHYMKNGLSVVFVETDSGLLLAHAFREPTTDNKTTEIRGWFSNRRGLGGRSMLATVTEALGDGAEQVYTSVQTGNTDGLLAIGRIGGEELFIGPSKTPGKKVIVFDVTKAKKPKGI